MQLSCQISNQWFPSGWIETCCESVKPLSVDCQCILLSLKSFLCVHDDWMTIMYLESKVRTCGRQAHTQWGCWSQLLFNQPCASVLHNTRSRERSSPNTQKSQFLSLVAEKRSLVPLALSRRSVKSERERKRLESRGLLGTSLHQGCQGQKISKVFFHQDLKRGCFFLFCFCCLWVIEDNDGWTSLLGQGWMVKGGKRGWGCHTEALNEPHSAESY